MRRNGEGAPVSRGQGVDRILFDSSRFNVVMKNSEDNNNCFGSLVNVISDTGHVLNELRQRECEVKIKQEPMITSSANFDQSEERSIGGEAAAAEVVESELAEVLDENDFLEADLAYRCCMNDDNLTVGQVSINQVSSASGLRMYLQQLQVKPKHCQWHRMDRCF